MFYQSTRDSSVKFTSAQAIMQGISEDGGLFVPSEIPGLTKSEFESLVKMSYNDRAKLIFGKFLTDFTDDEIAFCVDSAYNTKNFGKASITEFAEADGMSILELWHGPTHAFKDMALQILPYLLKKSVEKNNCEKEIVILVATSGDTGKAALEGFADVAGTRIIVFYPETGVSEMQKRQMATQTGANVNICAVRGNFDDCQNGVKKIFTDNSVKDVLEKAGMTFSSANSINWGRLAPQIVYYISAYADLVASGKIAQGDPVNICVPTGNFGNILAAYYALCMGLPVNKLICASNSNNVLTDFLKTGIYDRNREFFTTLSPSMDILISSNLERLLFHLSGQNDRLVSKWMNSLKTTGKYEVSSEVRGKITSLFEAGFCDDKETQKQIKATFNSCGYTLDTHTAVAVKVYGDYKAASGDETPVIIASTASPFKFSRAVLSAIDGNAPDDEFAAAEKLAAISGLKLPESLAKLRETPVRFKDTEDSDALSAYVKKLLGV
ncbi:MAG: threonine synthase [Ruminococcus sp.]|jgi:threonine synthase|nr:threonine synthase [Ruminococcus sp.]